MAIELVQGDTDPTLEIVCEDDRDVIIDLTDANEVSLTFKKVGADTYKFKRICLVTDPTAGLIEMDWEDGDLDTPGDYEGEVEIVFNCGKEQTSARLYYRVREELG